MPWFPDFANAAELARLQTRAAGQADPVAEYLTVLESGDVHALETVWPGEVVVLDPRAGEIRGHSALRRFVRANQAWLAEHQARVETVASTRAGGRAVVELLAHLVGREGETDWPVAVVAESRDDWSVVFRTYCSQWPVDGRRHVRPPILESEVAAPSGVVGRYLTGLSGGDVDGLLRTFAADAVYREPIGQHSVHRGTRELGTFFAECFNAGGGISLDPCAITDDGVRSALEYNCARWGSHELPPQAGIAVFERGPDGLLAAVRVYDDIEFPGRAR
jgi:hypothetical protein